MYIHKTSPWVKNFFFSSSSLACFFFLHISLPLFYWFKFSSQSLLIRIYFHPHSCIKKYSSTKKNSVSRSPGKKKAETNMNIWWGREMYWQRISISHSTDLQTSTNAAWIVNIKKKYEKKSFSCRMLAWYIYFFKEASLNTHSWLTHKIF